MQDEQTSGFFLVLLSTSFHLRAGSLECHSCISHDQWLACGKHPSSDVGVAAQVAWVHLFARITALEESCVAGAVIHKS